MVQAIRAAASGGGYFSPEVVALIIVDANEVRLLHKKQSRAATLTSREVEVLRYVARGLSEAVYGRDARGEDRTDHGQGESGGLTLPRKGRSVSWGKRNGQ